MKKSILIIMLLAVSSSLLAQQESTEPFKKANTITVYTNNSDSLNYYEFGRQLMKFDYSIDASKSDFEFKIIQTSYHQLKAKPGWNYSYNYNIVFTDGNIIIKIFWILGMDINVGMVRVKDDPNRWKWKKSGGDHHCWKETLEMLNDYGDYKITYSIK